MGLFKKQTEDLQPQAVDFAKEFVALDKARSSKFDYSFDSLKQVDAMLDELVPAYKDGNVDDKTLESVARLAGSYIFEVFRKQYGGTYRWHGQHQQPVLVIGEPEFEVAFLATEKAKARVTDGKADSIAFYAEGIVERIKAKTSALIT